MIRCLVFSGGGMKSLAYVGVYQALLEHKVIDNISTIIGTSAGSIISLMIALQYSIEELKDIYFNLDFKVLQDINPDRVFEFMDKFGLDSGINLRKMLQVILRTKMKISDCTFSELYQFTKKDVMITGTCLTETKCHVFSKDNTPDMSIIDAIIISSSVPFIYQSHTYKDNLYVDGGIMDNYPIGLYDNTEEVLGFLVASPIKEKRKIDNIFNYSYSLMLCISQRYLEFYKEFYGKYTVILETNNSAFNYTIALKDKQQLFELGYQKTKQYIRSHSSRFTKQNESKENKDNQEKKTQKGDIDKIAKEE